MSTKISNVIRIQDPSGLTYYLGSFTPEQIMQLTFVPCVVNVNSDVLPIRTTHGYQREGDKKRMIRINEFYSENTNSLIPPVLLSTRKSWRFIPKTSGSPFGVIEADDQAAIIDGQHRLGGLSMMVSQGNASPEALNRSVPFMAIDFEDIEVEADEFTVINGEQKGIKPSHLLYIRRDRSFSGSAAHLLKEDTDSVFCGRIGIGKTAEHDLIAFKAATEIVVATFDSVFCQNAFRPDASEENQLKAMAILTNYWKTVASVFSGMWHDVNHLPSPGQEKTKGQGRNKFEYRVLEETGLRALGRLGSVILLKSWMSASGEISWSSVETHLRKVAADPKAQLALQKIKPHNKEAILAIDPGLQFQGKAGERTLFNILYGALEKRD
jgi:DGQHR domain-containing protein